jgi:hypothetical protein
MTLTDFRNIYATKFGLPLTARFEHAAEEVERAFKEVKRQHPYHSIEEAMGRALARLDAKVHRVHAASAPTVTPQPTVAEPAPVSKNKDWRRKVEIGVFVFLILLVILLSAKVAHGQSTAVKGVSKGTTPAGSVTATSADANHTGLDVICVSGCAGSSGATTPSNAFANPTTAGLAMSFNAMWNGSSWDLVKGDTTSGLWVNCKAGCAGGASTPSNAFANPTTAGLSMSFNMMWNGTTWDLVKGDTTNGLWVNCKNGCAGGSSTPSDAFANPTTAGLSQGFTMMWNGSTWDRVKGDTTSGIWVNVKALPALAAGSAIIGKVGIDQTTPGTTNGVQVNAALPAGTNVIGHVINDSGSTTAVTGNVASTVADGANVVLGAKADAKSTATDTTAVTIMQVLKEISAMEQAPASRAVTNAGTFAVQDSTAETNTGTTATNTTGLNNTVSTPGSAVPSKAQQISGTDGTNAIVPYIDPCQRGAKSYAVVNLSTATTSRFAAPAASKKTYICSIVLVAGAADNVNIIEGTGGTCGTATAGVAGGTTAATGFNLSANGGLTMGNGQGAIFATAGTNVDMCLITSAAVQLSGHITYVQF